MSAKNQISIALEGIEHAVTVVRVDDHVGHAPDAMHRAQRLSIATPRSLNTQKPAAASRRAWCSPAMGNERAAAFSVEHGGDGIQYRADNDTRGLVYARKRGGVAVIEITFASVTACARARCSRGCETARDRPQYRQPERRPRPGRSSPDVSFSLPKMNATSIVLIVQSIAFITGN